jgi:hypothetical protein
MQFFPASLNGLGNPGSECTRIRVPTSILVCTGPRARDTSRPRARAEQVHYETGHAVGRMSRGLVDDGGREVDMHGGQAYFAYIRLLHAARQLP